MPIDYDNELNEAQREAVTTTDGSVLVIAGAGSGKTRTIVYRLAHLVEQGVDPAQILLLTFTRKASQEMLRRAEAILGRPLSNTSGGTFHSFAYSTLRMNAMDLGFENGFTLMDRSDSEGLVKDVKDDLKLGKGDRSYPKKSTLMDLITKSRNKELDMGRTVEKEAFHLAPYLDDLNAIADGYGDRKQSMALMDYDDLLFRFDRLLAENEPLRNQLQARYRYIMVDEYQDTNLVQARIVKHLVGDKGNVMAVGDDAQSIYAFRGANVNNILDFPKIFKDTKIIRLEQNYRSRQPILDLTNHILANAATKFDKTLFSDIKGGPLPQVIYPVSDQNQARIVVNKVLEYHKKYHLHDIAILFRAGYQSYHLEMALTRTGIDYKKYGGIRFNEAAHVKDVTALMRLTVNKSDRLAFRRSVEHIKGIGPKTADKIFKAIHTDNQKSLNNMRKKKPELEDLLNELDHLQAASLSPAQTLDRVLKFYQPVLQEKYPDDYPKRQAGLDQLGPIAANYRDMDQFLADLNLDGNPEDEKHEENCLVLSTVHSAKGLEWKAVVIIDLVEERFPSRKAMSRPEDLEEERRLMYVACTRAMEELALMIPKTIYNRYNGISDPVLPSPFVQELPRNCYDEFNESYGGNLQQKRKVVARPLEDAKPSPEPEFKAGAPAEDLGFCRHKIFGRGKIIARIPPNKCRVNFPGFGLKVIIEDYLELL